MGNFLSDKSKDRARLAQIEAEEQERARKAKEAADAAARKKAAENAAKRAKEEKAKNYESRIREKLSCRTNNWYWASTAEDLYEEAKASDVSSMIEKSLLNSLYYASRAVKDTLHRKSARKETLKKILCMIPVVLFSIIALAFALYAHLGSESGTLFKVAFAVDLVAMVVAIVVARHHIKEDNDTALKVICVLLAIVNAGVAIFMLSTGKLKTRDLYYDGGYVYEMVDGEYYLYDIPDDVKDLVISELSEDVVGISNGLLKEKRSLETIVFDVQLMNIEKKAFAGARSLESVTFLDGDYTIGANAFKACKKLEKVSFTGGSYTLAGDGIFAKCNLLKDIYCINGSFDSRKVARPLAGLDKINVHHDNSYFTTALKGAKELTLVVYNGTDSIYKIKPDVIVFAEGFDFSGSFTREVSDYNRKPFAPVMYFPTSVTSIPDIFGINSKKYDMFYQGSASEWGYVYIEGDEGGFLGGIFNVVNDNYHNNYITMHYNSNCKVWADN